MDTSDKTTLEQLNQEYVDAFMKADVEWYRKQLADDFVVIESDGSMLRIGFRTRATFEHDCQTRKTDGSLDQI
jgi:hypothetical protein